MSEKNGERANNEYGKMWKNISRRCFCCCCFFSSLKHFRSTKKICIIESHLSGLVCSSISNWLHTWWAASVFVCLAQPSIALTTSLCVCTFMCLCWSNVRALLTIIDVFNEIFYFSPFLFSYRVHFMYSLPSFVLDSLFMCISVALSFAPALSVFLSQQECKQTLVFWIDCAMHCTLRWARAMLSLTTDVLHRRRRRPCLCCCCRWDNVCASSDHKCECGIPFHFTMF